MKFKSATMTSASGSIGGMTASRNRGGMYFRGRGIPTNPNSTRQALVRAAFGNLVTQWQTTLTQVQREAWTTYASNTPRTNTLGDPLTLTGQQAFIASNTPRIQSNSSGLAVGASPATNAPTAFNGGNQVSGFSIFNADGDDTELNVNIAGLTSATGVALLYVGRAIPESRNFYAGPYQLAAAANVLAAASIAVFNATFADPTLWAAASTFDTGAYIPFRVIIAYDDGRVSTPYQSVAKIGDLI